MSLKELCIKSLVKTNENINYLKNLLGFEEILEIINSKRKEYQQEYYLLHKPNIRIVLKEYFKEELKLLQLNFDDFEEKCEIFPLKENIKFEHIYNMCAIIEDYNNKILNLKYFPYSFEYNPHNHINNLHEYYNCMENKNKEYNNARFSRNDTHNEYYLPGWIEDFDDPHPEAHKYIFPSPLQEDTNKSYSLITINKNKDKLLVEVEHQVDLIMISGILDDKTENNGDVLLLSRHSFWVLYLDALVLDPIIRNLPRAKVNPYI